MQIDRGIAIVRPPGHHAEAQETCGFCYFNNIAVAARMAQSKFKLSRIAIIDWDIHHGNGLQTVFYNDPSVLYISIHRFDNGDYFPQLKESNYDYVGEGTGEFISIWEHTQLIWLLLLFKWAKSGNFFKHTLCRTQYILVVVLLSVVLLWRLSFVVRVECVWSCSCLERGEYISSHSWFSVLMFWWGLEVLHFLHPLWP